MKTNEIISKNKLNANEVAEFLEITVEKATDNNYEHELEIDDLDDFAKKFGIGIWDIVTLRGYGKTKQVVLFWNYLTEDWESNATYHMEVVKEENLLFATKKEAEEALENLEKEADESNEALENSATDEEKEAYKEDKSNFERSRDSYLGYVNGNKKEFSKMYGDGNYFTFAEWLKNRR